MENEQEQDEQRHDDEATINLSTEEKRKEIMRVAEIKSKYEERQKVIKENIVDLETQVANIQNKIFEAKLVLKEVNYACYREVNYK